MNIEQEQEQCTHEFIHVSDKEDMINQYKYRWVATRVIIYCCKKCGKVALDEIKNNSAV